MAVINVYCEGPGPHDPPDGLLGQSEGDDGDIRRGLCQECLARDAAAATDDGDPLTRAKTALESARTVTDLKHVLASVMEALQQQP